MTDHDHRSARLATLAQHVTAYVSRYRGSPPPAELTRPQVTPVTVELTSPSYLGALQSALLERRPAFVR